VATLTGFEPVLLP